LWSIVAKAIIKSALIFFLLQLRRPSKAIPWPSEPLESSQLEFNNKITLYKEENHSKCSPILTLIREDMVNQGECLI